MIVPSRSLLYYFACVGIPAFALLGFAGGMGVVVAGIILAGLGVVVVDGLGAKRALAGIDVELSGTVRGTKGGKVEVPVVVQTESGGGRKVRVGIAFPSHLESEEEGLVIEVPDEEGSVSERWEVDAIERGFGEVNEYYLEGDSPMGLWMWREKRECALEFRIYPDLTLEKKALAPLFLRRGQLGSHLLRQVGKGRDFEQLRDYVPGDSYEDIYWKGTARRGAPVTKVFQVERTQDIYVVVDVSRRSGRSLEWNHDEREDGVALAKTQAERFIQASLTLALAAENQGDRFGLVTFSDQVHDFVRAKGGQQHFGTVRDAIYALEARPVNPDFDELFTQLRNRLGNRGLVLFFTDLADPVLAESFVESVTALSRQHLVVVITLGVPGVEPMFGRGDDGVANTSEVYERLAGHLMWADGEELGTKLAAIGVRLISAGQEALAAEAVTAYLNIKRRQVL